MGVCASDDTAQQATTDLASQRSDGLPGNMATDIGLTALKQERMPH